MQSKNNSSNKFTSIEQAILELKLGNMIVLADDEDRENEGDIVVAAQFITQPIMDFLIKNARGLPCLAIDETRFRQLKFYEAHKRNSSRFETAFANPIDAKEVENGFSAQDRCLTIQKVVNYNSNSDDFLSPGSTHIVVGRRGGVLVRSGHTEASIDLMNLAGLSPCGVICEIVRPDGKMARRDDLFAFCKTYKLKLVNIASLIAWRLKNESLITKKSVSSIQTPHGSFIYTLFHSEVIDGNQIIVLSLNNDKTKLPIVRVHMQNFLHDSLFNLRHLDSKISLALKKIAKHGYGHLVIMKVADERLSFTDQTDTKIKLKEYGIGAQILVELEVKDMILLTDTKINPVALSGFDLNIVSQINLV